MTEKRYTIELNEKQLNIIRIALEEYFRISLNQWYDVAERMAFKCYNSENDPSRHGFHRAIQARNTAKAVLEAVGSVTLSTYNVKNEDDTIAVDMWRTIEHFQYVEKNGEKEDVCNVASYEPYYESDEPPITIKAIAGKNNKKKKAKVTEE